MSKDNIPAAGGGKEAATIVVAASDSDDTSRADYVCPGADDLDYITTVVLPLLPAGGGSIELLEGNYYVSTNLKPLLINAQNNVTIRGQGKGTHLQLSNGIQSNIIQVQSSAGILIEDLFCDGTTSAASAGVDTNQNGIYFNNVDDSTIKNIYSLNNKRFGINLYNGSERNVVIGCTVTGNGSRGIYVYSSSFNKISGNMCKSNVHAGIYLIYSENNTISSNLCLGDQSEGIATYINSRYNTITGNVCKDNTIEEIFIGGGCDFSVISGNICGSGNKGIWLDQADYCTIVSNVFYDNSSNNIHLIGCIGIIIKGNIVYKSSDVGINISGSSYCTIIGNNIYYNSRNGIYMTNSGTTYSQHNNISGNNIHDNSRLLTNFFDGIRLDNQSSYNSIQENTIRETRHRYGIRIDTADCEDNVVIDNDVKDASTANLSDAGTDTEIKNNYGYINEGEIRDAIANILETIGDARALWPFHETSGVTVNDYSRRNHDLTPSSDVSVWDTKPDWKGRAALYTFNAVGEELDTPDHADFEFGNAAGNDDSPFSLISLVYLFNNLTVAAMQVNPATGDFTNPANINDNNVATFAAATATDIYCEIDLGANFAVSEFRTHGNAGNNNDGAFKIQLYDIISGSWKDAATAIATTGAAWTGWVRLSNSYPANKLRVVCTTVDTGGSGSLLGEIEVRGDTERTLFAKFNEATPAREYKWVIDSSDRLRLELYDESVTDLEAAFTNAALTMESWLVLISTYSGNEDATGITHYVDGISVADTDDHGGAAYIGMEQLTALPSVAHIIGAGPTPINFLGAKATWFAVTGKELSADEAWLVTQRLKGLLGI